MKQLNFFKIFWSNDIIQTLVEQTNIYSVQFSGLSINTSVAEIEQLIDMQLMMSLIRLPSYIVYWSTTDMYWSNSQTMSIKRYELLHWYLHVVNNTTRNKDSVKSFKIKPFRDALCSNCLKVEQEHDQSLDEKMTPAETKWYSSVSS